WYAGCINETSYYTNILFCYGLCSFISIIFLSMLTIFCNLKQKFMFFLVLVQQMTLLSVLFYWDPVKANDFSSSNIYFVFFGCFATCESLWLVFNLRNLLKKSTYLEKSPVAILVYGFSIYCLGSFGGYGARDDN
ncbi:unnamed protein product, partial [Brachionus calyciflorus]